MRETSRPLTLNEFKNIVKFCERKYKKVKNINLKYSYFRNLCLFSMMWFTGCRPKETYASLLSDLDLRSGNFFINGNRNKTRKTRVRKIHPKLKLKLCSYLRLRKILYPESKYLFPSTKINNHISKRSLQHSFQRIIKKLNLLEVNYIDKKNVPRYSLNIYSFRKGHGTYLYEKTGDPYLVQKSLDHKHIQTTIEFYIRSIPEVINKKILAVF